MKVKWSDGGYYPAKIKGPGKKAGTWIIQWDEAGYKPQSVPASFIKGGKKAAAPKAAAPAAKPADQHLTDAQIKSLGSFKHVDGNGNSWGNVGEAVKAVRDGNPTPDNLLALLVTNRYGGPAANYRRSVAKGSQIDGIAAGLEAATKAAKKLAPKVIAAETKKVDGEIASALSKITSTQFAEHLAKTPNKAKDNNEWAQSEFEKAKQGKAVESHQFTLLYNLDKIAYGGKSKLADRKETLQRLSNLVRYQG